MEQNHTIGREESSPLEKNLLLDIIKKKNLFIYHTRTKHCLWS